MVCRRQAALRGDRSVRKIADLGTDEKYGLGRGALPAKEIFPYHESRWAVHAGDVQKSSGPTNEASALVWLARNGLDACDLADRSPVEAALSLVRPSMRMSDAACLAVRAALSHLSGDNERALELYRKALRRSEGSELGRRVRENLSVLLVNQLEPDEAERFSDEAIALDPNDAPFLGLRASIRAGRHDRRAADDIARVMELLEEDLPPLWLFRGALRAATAAFYRCEYDLSEHLAYKGLQVAKELSAWRFVSNAYELLWLIKEARNELWAAHEFARLSVGAAEKAGDESQRLFMMGLQYQSAIFLGDEETATELRGRLPRSRLLSHAGNPGQFIVADCVYSCWMLDFGRARDDLLRWHVDQAPIELHALYHGLRAAISLALGDETTASKAAHAAVSIGRPRKQDTLALAHYRAIGRTVAAAVLLEMGKRHEATRALATCERSPDLRTRAFARAVRERGYHDLAHLAPGVVGFAKVLERLHDAIKPVDTELTKREILVLQHSALGETSAEIANALEVSLATVKWHKQNAFRKLGVSRINAALREARERNLIK